MLGSYDGIKLGSTDGRVIIIILGNVYGITLRIDVGTEMRYYMNPLIVLMISSSRVCCLEVT